jgi:hypothetical protein
MIQGMLLRMAIALALASPALAAEEQAPAQGPLCVSIILVDDKNIPIKTEVPGVAVMVGTKPILPSTFPSGIVRQGETVSCPADLVQEIVDNYTEACLTDERRRRTAAEHRVTLNAVTDNCRTIRESLGSALSAAR